MIKVEVQEPTTQAWQDLLTECLEEKNRVVEAYRNTRDRPIKNRIYKKFDFLLLAKDGPFHGKCAFCETVIDEARQHGDVEHYRPKKAVQDIDFAKVTIVEQGVERDHPGYYWLAYDWTNLLPACVLCNQPSTHGGTGLGKRNRFPIAGVRATNEADDPEQEDPYLLNPVVDDPASHLEVDETGVMFSKSQRGEHTIAVLGLNAYDLPMSRKSAYSRGRRLVYELVDMKRLGLSAGMERFDEAEEALSDIMRGAASYAMAARKGVAQAKKEILELL